MTDEHRRSSDTKIDLLLTNQQTHMSDYHANMKPGDTSRYVKKVDAMEVTDARILTILDGEQVFNASGESKRVGGMSRDVAEMKTAMNGGHLAIATRDKLLIIGANGLFALGVAWMVGSG
ncbi:hypothetical protein LCGC14_2176330 [marine sediment metagenome]|uniref:Uncharacterized protein n=1 Tax=marine sediment metagenome TaxID=412755 RepID=A0A0F9DNJ6_9ZZZZ